ncbi:hypothetical protein P8452_07820 [Trifolium repens]|nr:hypothetical protein P8452_07820 [Trifolium repens]
MTLKVIATRIEKPDLGQRLGAYMRKMQDHVWSQDTIAKFADFNDDEGGLLVAAYKKVTRITVDSRVITDPNIVLLKFFYSRFVAYWLILKTIIALVNIEISREREGLDFGENLNIFIMILSPWSSFIIKVLPLISGGEIAPTFDNLGSIKLGYCGLIEGDSD